MTHINIHNFLYFLEELQKNLTQIEDSLEKQRIALDSIHILHNTMAKMFENCLNQLQHQQ